MEKDGNRNGIPEPSETIELGYRFINVGPNHVIDGHLVSSTETPGVTLSDNVRNWNRIAVGLEANNMHVDDSPSLHAPALGQYSANNKGVLITLSDDYVSGTPI